MRHALIRQKTSVAFSVQTVAVLTSAAVLCSSALAQDTASEPASAPSETVAPENAVAQDADAQPSDEKTLSAKAAEATKKAAQAATEITDKVVDTVKTAIEKARAETVSNDGTAGTTTQATASSDQPVSDKAKASDDGGPDNQKSVATAAADPGQESVSGTEPSEIVGVSQAVIDDYDTNLEPLFKYFHSNPELSFRETKTASRLAAELGALGYQVTQGVGETGVVAVLENGEGPTVMLRADMDGLPIEERSGLEYASKVTQQDIDGVVKPVMHACGHDVHITSLVG
ncbi:MAG: M20/M25/M40 family metallo-hydrolase, partial [Pseudomonadota bacterium]